MANQPLPKKQQVLSLFSKGLNFMCSKLTIEQELHLNQ